MLTAIVLKEKRLGHIAEFFIEWRRMEMNERLNPVQEDIRIPANTAYTISGEAARQFKTGLIPQRIIQGDNGKKTNFIELDGIQIRFQFQEVSNETLRRTVGDLEFLLIEERTTTTASWGGSGNALHLAPNKFGPTRKSLKEKI